LPLVMFTVAVMLRHRKTAKLSKQTFSHARVYPMLCLFQVKKPCRIAFIDVQSNRYAAT
jgi:hypothetical protein